MVYWYTAVILNDMFTYEVVIDVLALSLGYLVFLPV